MILKLEFKKSIKSSSVRHRTNTVVCPRRKRFVLVAKTRSKNTDQRTVLI